MNALKQFKDEAGLSYEAMSKRVSYGATAIWNHCRTNKIPAEAAIVYQRAFGISLNELRPDLWPTPQPPDTSHASEA